MQSHVALYAQCTCDAKPITFSAATRNRQFHFNFGSQCRKQNYSFCVSALVHREQYSPSILKSKVTTPLMDKIRRISFILWSFRYVHHAHGERIDEMRRTPKCKKKTKQKLLVSQARRAHGSNVMLLCSCFALSINLSAAWAYTLHEIQI